MEYSTEQCVLSVSQVPLLPEDHIMDRTIFPKRGFDINMQQIDLRKHNSWVMRMHEVSTPELAEVFAINAITPFSMLMLTNVCVCVGLRVVGKEATGQLHRHRE